MAKKPQSKIDETGPIFDKLRLLDSKLLELANREKELLGEIRRIKSEIGEGEQIGPDASPEDVIQFLERMNDGGVKKRLSELWREVDQVRIERKKLRKVRDKFAWEARNERIRQLRPQLAQEYASFIPLLEELAKKLRSYEEMHFEASRLTSGGMLNMSFGRLNSRLLEGIVSNMREALETVSEG